MRPDGVVTSNILQNASKGVAHFLKKLEPVRTS